MNARRTVVALGIALGLAGVAIAQETTRTSVDSSGAEGNDASWPSAISADGQIVAFTTYASNLVSGDTNGPSRAIASRSPLVSVVNLYWNVLLVGSI